PILVLSTAADPVTPEKGTIRAAERIPGAVRIAWQGAGHGALGSGCVADEVTAFLVDGAVPEDGTLCPALFGPWRSATRSPASPQEECGDQGTVGGGLDSGDGGVQHAHTATRGDVVDPFDGVLGGIRQPAAPCPPRIAQAFEQRRQLRCRGFRVEVPQQQLMGAG